MIGSAGRTASPTAHRRPLTHHDGKIERYHESLRVELLDDHPPFADLAAAQAAIDAWRADYNTVRPHQSLDMASPASRFRPAPADGLPLRLPAGLVPVSEAVSGPVAARTNTEEVTRHKAYGTMTRTTG